MVVVHQREADTTIHASLLKPARHQRATVTENCLLGP